jgi:hypothetical protein
LLTEGDLTLIGSHTTVFTVNGSLSSTNYITITGGELVVGGSVTPLLALNISNSSVKVVC